MLFVVCRSRGEGRLDGVDVVRKGVCTLHRRRLLLLLREDRLLRIWDGLAWWLIWSSIVFGQS